jgi:hypothetical protein
MIDPRITAACLLLLMFTGSFPALGQGEWELREDKNGIRVFSRENELSDFDEFRATTEVVQSLEAFIAVLKDVPAIPEWMYSVKYSQLLEAQGDTVQIYYTEAKAPFPFKNRDGIYFNRFRWDKAARSLTVDIELRPDYLDQKDNLVRISRGSGFWLLEENDRGTLDLTFQMQVDPGGTIPAWLANMFVVDTPLHTLAELKRLMADDRYHGKKYEFLEKQHKEIIDGSGHPNQ